MPGGTPAMRTFDGDSTTEITLGEAHDMCTRWGAEPLLVRALGGERAALDLLVRLRTIDT